MDVGAFDDILRIEVNFHILAESTGVFIPYSFAVSKGLEDWIASQDAAFNSIVFPAAERGEQLHAVFG